MPAPQVDVALVEAGLGGARDATNVFDPPQLKAAILTAVGLEHQAALGEPTNRFMPWPYEEPADASCSPRAAILCPSGLAVIHVQELRPVRICMALVVQAAA